MTCREFRDLFVRLLQEDPPPAFPAEEYRRHFVSCLPCQVLLSVREVEEQLADYASSRPSRLSTVQRATILRRARRTATIRTLVRRTGVAAFLVLLFVAGPLLLSGGSDKRPAPTPIRAEPPLPLTVQEFARQFEDGEFALKKTIHPGFEGMAVLIFRRSDPTADQYEFVKRIAVSDFVDRYPDAPKLLVTVTDETGDDSIFQVLMSRADLIAARWGSHREEPATTFLRRFLITHDGEKGTELKGE